MISAFESALVEMSGGCLDRVSEPFDFGKLQSKFLAGSLLTVCTKDHHKNPAGLKLGSPYGILDMCEAQGFQLIRLRNPYGDHSGKWTGTIPFGKKTELRDRLGAHNKNKDGTFWMPFKEFCALFADTLYVCRLFKQDFRNEFIELSEIEIFLSVVLVYVVVCSCSCSCGAGDTDTHTYKMNL